MTQYPTWPRKLVNFPVILIAVVQQYFVALALILNPDAHYATSVHILVLVFPTIFIAPFLICAASLVVYGFTLKLKINTVLCLIPQQFMLYLSAGGAFRAIWEGQFADGVTRSHAFLLADQCPMILIAFFHSWAMVLIMKHGANNIEE